MKCKPSGARIDETQLRLLLGYNHKLYKTPNYVSYAVSTAVYRKTQQCMVQQVSRIEKNPAGESSRIY